MIRFDLTRFFFQDESISNRSSLGLLPKELLEVTQTTADDDTFDWPMTNSMLKKPDSISKLPKTSSKKEVMASPKGIDDRYLVASENKSYNPDFTTPLDQLLGSTMGKYIFEFSNSKINSSNYNVI